MIYTEEAQHVLQSSTTTPAHPVSAADRAHAVLHERILDGTLPGGTLISEGQIADELGVSRTPVREAFLRLQAEGWMELFPKRGALVRPVQPGEIAEVIEARQVIESAAVRKVCLDSDAATLLAAHLAEVVANQNRAAAAGDLTAFARADVDFHQGIVDAGDNSILREVYRTLRDRQQRMTARSVRARAGQLDAIVGQHTELARLIADQDAAGFTRALIDHMHDIHRDLLR
ncbi:transcriptional regulator, GntR family [Sanguibacter gelidistatuariae]|uniref:Transcriptional regulator, GntR family n=1 Tax=Sanguibacter gelidistatuariae TaxID=1814289 RepID=A0A1G6WU71_9MICO|nr:GntR family transcriptional regulator [Sanguibacter gelidistatuariae]SDD69432.1 transcriptional regulator, GntR family [Sanguibacter gelidistatuariae]